MSSTPRNFNLQRELDERDDVLDWHFGALSSPALVSIPLAERDQYLPVGETQFDAYADFTDCASRSPVNHMEAIFTYHYLHAMLPENKKWFEDNSYVQNGKITFSDRYIAILSGTTHEGNSLKSPIETIRKQGLIPKALLPKEDTMTWEQYYDSSKITPFLKSLGQEFLSRFTIEYEQVAQVHFADVLKDDMLGVAGFAWPDPVNGVYPPTDGAFNHAFLVYKLPQWQIFDNYLDPVDNDFEKNLSPSYKFYEYGYRVYVAKEQLPSAAPVSIYDQLAALLARIAALWPIVVPTPPVNPIPSVNLLNTFCLAVQKHEGWILNPPSRSVRNHNPGNCRYSSVGYLDKYLPVGKDKDNFAIFKDYATGFLYLKNLVLQKAKKHPLWDLYTFFGDPHEGWAPDSDGNNSKHYAEVVALALNVPPTWKIGNLIGITGVDNPFVVGTLSDYNQFTMDISPAWLGFIRGIGVVVIMAVLTYLANATNLTPVLGNSLAAIIASLALALENGMEGRTGKAGFGALRSTRS